MSDEGSQESPEPDPSSAEQSVTVRPGAILMIVVPIALLMGGAVVFFGMFDGAQWLSDAAKPARANTKGRVTYNGEPLPDAVIETRPANGDLRGAIATGDDQGKFKLLTQFRGDFLDGAYIGEHQVTVKRYDMNVMTLGAPPLLTPSKYASFDTSPLRITVKEGGTEIVLHLEGEPDAPTARRGPQRQMRPPEAFSGDRRKRGSGSPTKQEIGQDSGQDSGQEIGQDSIDGNATDTAADDPGDGN
jgi:hypothetical protein